MPPGVLGHRPQRAVAGPGCQCIACSSPRGHGLHLRRPLLARTRALLKQQDGSACLHLLAASRPTHRAHCSRRLACHCQMLGPKTPLRPSGQDTAGPPEDHPMSWLAAPNFRLSEADRAECQARLATIRSRSVKPAPGSSEEAVMLWLLATPTVDTETKKKLLLLGLLAYLDFADVVAKAGFDIDWERMEAPPEIICDIFDDEVIADGQRHFYSEVVGLREFDLRGKALPSSKDVRKGPSAPKGFGGGAAKPSRGRKKKAAAPPRKKTQGELLWELQKRQIEQERQQEQAKWAGYEAELIEHYGPMTREELEDYHSQMDYWDLARDIFNTAFTRLFWATHGRGTSMDFAVSLLRAVRFATVIGMVILLEENTGQGLLSGVGTALKDALSLGREVSSKDGLRLTLSDVARLGNAKHGQALLSRLEASDSADVRASPQPAREPKELGVSGSSEAPEDPGLNVHANQLRRWLDKLMIPVHPVLRERRARVIEMLEAQYEESAVGEVADGGPLEILGTDAAAAQADGLSSAPEQTMGASSDATQTMSSEQISDALQEQLRLPEQASAEPGGVSEDAVQVAAAEQQLQPVQDPSEALAADTSETEPDSTPGTAEAEAASAQQAQQLPEEVQQAEEVSGQLLEPSQHPSDAPQPSFAAFEQQNKASEELAEALQESAEAAEQLDRAAEASDDVLQELQEASEQLAEAAEAVSQSPKPAKAQPELGILLSSYPADDAGGSASSATTSPGLKEHLGSFFDSIRSKDEQPVTVGPFFDGIRSKDKQPGKADASAAGLSARRVSPPQRKPPARSRDGWSTLPAKPMDSPQPSGEAPGSWQMPLAPRIQARVQHSFQQGAYIARQLLPTDMRNWKAAGILAYTVDARGLYVLLGKLEPGAAVQQGSSRYREGWWILGGKRSGADYSAESTAVREMYEETSGLLCGRDVCGGQLADVMWIPQGNYALFPVFIPGKPNIPSAFAQKKAALERRTLRRVRRGPRQMSAIGWIPLKSIMDGRCRTHPMLLRMLRDTTLVAYLQQMHQLVLQQGSPGYVVPVAPNSGWGPADQEPHEASDSAAEAPADRSSSHDGGSAGWSTSTESVSSLGYEDTRMPQRSRHTARPAASAGSQGSAASVAALNGSSSGRRRAVPHAAEPASAVEPAHGAEPRSALGAQAGNGVGPASQSQHSAPAASPAARREARAAAAPTAKHEAEQAARRTANRQRQSQPWEQELHAPKPYKPAVIRRGRRRGRRSLGLSRQSSAKPAT
ncbi:hypothetical protein CVIRNUC_001780 [Coccomyxa viridis]|uniref:Nudix hydrolase domain-containing protein n=1 Tax=Coccomyxa viridis TaxID=1274662 RepID=A0AAV1HXJ4_9CHLO|nr:hypothetical protein CVIRNUC_001780 [Coccomyxa viridis]